MTSQLSATAPAPAPAAVHCAGTVTVGIASSLIAAASGGFFSAHPAADVSDRSRERGERQRRESRRASDRESAIIIATQ